MSVNMSIAAAASAASAVRQVQDPPLKPRTRRMQAPYSPPPGCYEKEDRLTYVVDPDSWTFAVISGSVEGSLATAGEDDDAWIHTPMELIVGPWWCEVEDVEPLVAITGLDRQRAGDGDEPGWSIEHLRWDTVGGTDGPHLHERRIRLRFTLGTKGGRSRITRIGYTLTAGGRGLGKGGVNSP